MTFEAAVGRRERRGYRTPSVDGATGAKQRSAGRESAKVETFNKGIEILRKVGAVSFLDNLQSSIILEQQDARLRSVDPDRSVDDGERFRLLDSGMVETSMGWGYPMDEDDDRSYKRINVLAHPVTGDVIVEGIGPTGFTAKELDTKLGLAQLEDAIFDAYDNPGYYRAKRIP